MVPRLEAPREPSPGASLGAGADAPLSGYQGGSGHGAPSAAHGIAPAVAWATRSR